MCLVFALTALTDQTVGRQISSYRLCLAQEGVKRLLSLHFCLRVVRESSFTLTSWELIRLSCNLVLEPIRVRCLLCLFLAVVGTVASRARLCINARPYPGEQFSVPILVNGVNVLRSSCNFVLDRIHLSFQLRLRLLLRNSCW